MKLEKVEDYHEITYMVLKRKQMTNSICVCVKPPDLAAVQELLRQSLPYIIGWGYLEILDSIETELKGGDEANVPPYLFENDTKS